MVIRFFTNTARTKVYSTTEYEYSDMAGQISRYWGKVANHRGKKAWVNLFESFADARQVLHRLALEFSRDA